MNSPWQSFALFCAPMEGVMQPPVISACNNLALVGMWITPFLRISRNVPKRTQIRQFLAPFEPEKRPVVLQLMGVDPEKTADAARLALPLGIAGVDLNLGCPSRQVTHHGAGAGALRREVRTQTLAVAAALRKAVPEGGFSVKMRIGWSDPAEFSELLPALVRHAAPDCVTVHCRTAREGYRPVPDRMARFAAIADCARSCGVRFLLNGDIGTSEEAQMLMRTTGADGVMIGRGFWHDPWILKRLEAPGNGAPTPEIGRRILWKALLRELANPDAAASRGKAVELAHLILGADSEAARTLRALPDGEFPVWLAEAAQAAD